MLLLCYWLRLEGNLLGMSYEMDEGGVQGIEGGICAIESERERERE
jgi:hypothetical protein